MVNTVLHCGDLISFHSSLLCVDRVNLGDDDPAAEAPEGLSRALADVTVASNHCNLSSEHDIGGSLDSVNQGLPAAVEVVELGLGHRVVDVDGGDLQGLLGEHLVQVVNTSGGLLGQAVDSLDVLGELLMDKVGEISSVVKDHVQWLAIGEDEGLLRR